MSKRDSLPSGEVERAGLIGKILRRTRSKQNVQNPPAPSPAVETPTTSLTAPPARSLPNTAAAVQKPAASNEARHHHDAGTRQDQAAALPRSSYMKHKKSKPSLVSLMLPAADSSSTAPAATISTPSSQPKLTLRSRFNKKEQPAVQAPRRTQSQDGVRAPRRTQSQDGFGYLPQHAATSFQRTTGWVANAGYYTPAQRRRGMPDANVNIAIPEPDVEIHDGTDDDSSDYQKFVQQAIEHDRRQREAWRVLAKQQTYKVVAETTVPSKQGIFSWQRSAAKKKENEERRRTFAGEGQLYGFPASETSCELSRKSLSRKSSRSSRLSRKSSLKQLIVDYIKPPGEPSEHEMLHYGVKRKTSSKRFA